MQANHLRIEDQLNPIAQTWEQSAEELQDAVSRFLPLFRRRAYRYLGNWQDAEDAVQDALLSAYKHLDQFQGSAKITTWLTSIVTNSAVTQLRRRPRQPHSSLDETMAQDQNQLESHGLVDARPNPEDECSMSELRAHLMRSVGKLSPVLREVIQVRDFDGLNTSEAAHLLGVPEGTIKARVWRARSQLKGRAGLGLKPTPAPAATQGLGGERKSYAARKKASRSSSLMNRPPPALS